MSAPAEPPAQPPTPGLLARWAALRRRTGPRPAGPPGPWVLVAAWGPCGFAPVAPGTFGTLGAIPLAWWASRYGLAGELVALAAVAVLGTIAAHRAARYWGVADASPIVIDEVAGYLVTMLAVPFTAGSALLGFLLFRLCDVLKPWPASTFDRMKSAFGVTMDDVAAGVWAAILLRLLGLALERVLGCDGGGAWYCGV